MKNNTKRTLSALGMGLFCLASLTGCSASGADIVIKVLNCEDYIGESEFDFTYTYEDKNGEEQEVTETYPTVLKGFEAYESRLLGKKVRVIYDCYDTNETMLSSLQTGKTSYDLIAASDYAIQKMMRLEMLQPIDRERVPNYNAYCSRFLLDIMESITAPINGVECKMADYSVGYMWGTLGILYNPAKVSRETGVDEDTVKFDMQSWDSLWDVKYKNQMSVKDSMRDTYSVGIMKQYGDEIREAMEKSGCFDMEDGMYSLLPGKYEEAVATYNGKLTDIFNRCDEKHVQEVREALLSLKENVFGFEVDSGKDDMVKGLIGMNLAWSGDAVYSMDRAENEAGNTVYYSVPKTGGNIWFDSWSIPKTSDAEHKAVAEDFLNFISDPQVAAANMNDIGYTSFIAGETVHTLIRLWFDPRSYAMYVYHDASGDEGCTWEDSDFVYGEPEYLQEVDEEGNPVFEDLLDEEGNPVLDDEGNPIKVPVYVQETDEDGNPVFEVLLDENGDPVLDENGDPVLVPVYVRVEGDPEYDEELGIQYQGGFDLENDDVTEFDFEQGILNMAGSTFDQPVVDGNPVTWDEFMELYNAKAELVNAKIAAAVEKGAELEELEPYEGWDVRDLSYMFSGTINEGDASSENPEQNYLLFYTDELETIAVEETEVMVGRQFYAQYPDQTMIPKLAVMRDYGENNIYVLKMWSDVKSNNLPIVAVVVFGIIIAAAAVLIVGLLLTKRHYHKFRVERRKAVAAAAKENDSKRTS
ncbi:MAG: extracellular solute-binding protein [Bacilli bacterium]|nr:extracellular solute-binding protein [Bacilli bacterium]